MMSINDVSTRDGLPPQDGRERRKIPRLSLTHELFRLSENGKIFSVVDLSIDGLAIQLVEPDDLFLFSAGRKIEGLLNIRREKYLVKARVRNFTGNRIGLQFEELSMDTVSALKRFLDPVVLGKELKPMPVSGGKSTLWYHGPSGTDLLLWRGVDGQYFRFSVFIQGNYIQWQKEEGGDPQVSTGTLDNAPDHTESWGIVRFETLLLKPDLRIDSGKLEIAKTLILSSNLPTDLKAWCSRHLAHS